MFLLDSNPQNLYAVDVTQRPNNFDLATDAQAAVSFCGSAAWSASRRSFTLAAKLYMPYQLPPLLDDDEFERLVRDILRRVYNNPGIERFGRKGQSQFGVDGIFPANSTITFQCKLKDTRYETDARIRAVLMKEMEEELAKTAGLSQPLTRFIFASTFKNDTNLQEKASSLSSDTLTVESWGWDTINERVWEFAEALIPVYYPQFPVRPVHGFRHITPHRIETSRINDRDQVNRLALDYYRINERADVVFQVVCNGVDG